MAGEQWGWDVSALGVLGYRHGLEPTLEAAHRAALQAAVRLLRGWLGEAERELGEHQPLPPPAGGQ